MASISPQLHDNTVAYALHPDFLADSYGLDMLYTAALLGSVLRFSVYASKQQAPLETLVFVSKC
jgi:hypothetical protein